MKMKKILFVALSLLLLLAFGCSHDTNNSSVTNPNPTAFKATGSIQGTVRDACTTAPIVNALVDIGIKSTRTNKDGFWILEKVPATSYVDEIQIDGSLGFGGSDIGGGGGHANLGIDTGFRGNYSVTINMKDATINGVKATNYASFYNEEVVAFYSSMEPLTGIINATNAKITPVDGLMSGDNDFYVGQMTASITGYAVDANAQTLAGYKVYLLSRYSGAESNSTTGLAGNLVQIPNNPATTDGTGKFVFANIEAKQNYRILVVDTTMDAAKFMGYKNVTAPSCGLTSSLGMIPVVSTDNICPFPLSITADGHANYADIAKEEIADGVNVVFTFSKPIQKTELNTGRGLVATYTSYDPHNLYGDIAVNYEGYKDSNIHHTLTWNTAMTQLTVNIPAEALQPASIYTVKILDNSNLMGSNGLALTNIVGTFSDSTPYYTCASFNAGVLGQVGIQFTTYGARVAKPVAGLHYRQRDNPEDDAQLDYNDEASIDWAADPSSGAKSYNIWCRMIQFPQTTTCVPDTQCPGCNNDICTTVGGQFHPFYLVANTTLTGYDLNFQGTGHINPDGNDQWYEFVENLNIKLSYECYVAAVDADKVESIDPATGLPNQSNHIIIEDTDPPHITSVSAIGGSTASLTAGSTIEGIEVCFSEPMNEYLVEHAVWTINGDAFMTGTATSTKAYGHTVATANYLPGSNGCYSITFDDAYITRLINSVPCGTPGLVDVTLLSMTAGTNGPIADIAGNILQDPSEHCTAPDCDPKLPFIFQVMRTACQ